MKKPFSWICAFFLAWHAVLPAYAAVREQIPLKLQAYQARDFDAGKERVFNSTMTVLQDLGCIITSAEIRTGYVSAKSPTSSDGSSLKMTAIVIRTGNARSRIRLTALRCTPGGFSGFSFSGFYNFWGWFPPSGILSVLGLHHAEEHLVEKPAMYERFFARISEAILTQSHVKGE